MATEVDTQAMWNYVISRREELRQIYRRSRPAGS